MSMGSSESTHLTPALQPAVAFDIGFGSIARENGYVYDVDSELLGQSLVAGGMMPEDIENRPVIITPTESKALGGKLELGPNAAPGSLDNTQMRLYSYEGTGPITAKMVAHEGRHMADWADAWVPKSMNEKVQRVRKAIATVGAMAVGSAYAYLYASRNVEQPLRELVPAFMLDVGLSTLLSAEYATRSNERRARQAERLVPHKDILSIKNTDGTDIQRPHYRMRKTLGVIRALLVPNFSL